MSQFFYPLLVPPCDSGEYKKGNKIVLCKYPQLYQRAGKQKTPSHLRTITNDGRPELIVFSIAIKIIVYEGLPSYFAMINLRVFHYSNMHGTFFGTLCVLLHQAKQLLRGR